MATEDTHLLREILVELRALRQQVESRHGIDRDSQFLSVLLPAIGGRFGSSIFSTRECFADASLAAVIHPRNAVQLGLLLSRLAKERTATDGFLVERVDSENNAALWRLLRVLGLPSNSKTPSVHSRAPLIKSRA